MDRNAEREEHPLSRAMLESGLVQKLALDRDGKNSGVLSEMSLSPPASNMSPTIT